MRRVVATTMRTPGRDADLAVGYLIAESVLRHPSDIASVAMADDRVTVELPDGVIPETCGTARTGYQNSSCGMCGKTSIEAALRHVHDVSGVGPIWDADRIPEFTDQLRLRQPLFSRSGGVHGCGLMDAGGEFIEVAEDVGRHNALDKLIGSVWRRDRARFKNSMLVVSGRVSFELVQKALIVGVPIMVAVGAPSTMAVSTAERYGQTIIGFVRDGRYNVYCHSERLRTDATGSR